MGDQQKTGRDGLQLQGNIGDDTDDRNVGGEPTQSGAFTVAGGNKIGNGGDTVNFADPDDFLPDRPAQQRHQGRSDING